MCSTKDRASARRIGGRRASASVPRVSSFSIVRTWPVIVAGPSTGCGRDARSTPGRRGRRPSSVILERQRADGGASARPGDRQPAAGRRRRRCARTGTRSSLGPRAIARAPPRAQPAVDLGRADRAEERLLETRELVHVPKWSRSGAGRRAPRWVRDRACVWWLGDAAARAVASHRGQCATIRDTAPMCSGLLRSSESSSPRPVARSSASRATPTPTASGS